MTCLHDPELAPRAIDPDNRLVLIQSSPLDGPTHWFDGFSQSQYLNVLSAIFLSNILWNVLFGMIGDRWGWRRTVAICGGFGCTLSTLALYYVPLTTHLFSASIITGMLYGATLAGYVPLSAPLLAPEPRGEALSLLSLGASAAMLLGPAIVAFFCPG